MTLFLIINFVSSNLGDNNKNDDQPDVSKDGGGGRYNEDGKVLDPPGLAVGDAGDADGRDGEQVEGGRPHDGAGAKFFRLKTVANDPDHGEKNLGGR